MQGGRETDVKLVKDSKKFSRFLRHCSERCGCTVDEYGWADMGAVSNGTGLPGR